MGLNIQIRDGKLKVGFFDKRDSFLIFRMPHKSSNVPSSIVLFGIDADLLRIPSAFSTAIKPLIACMGWQEIFNAKLNSYIRIKYSDLFTNIRRL